MKLSRLKTIIKEELKALKEQGWSGVSGDPCCPVYNRPGYASNWLAYNHYDQNGNACTGGCGSQKAPMGKDMMERERLKTLANLPPETDKVHVSPNWCCEWTMIVGTP
tara:strand:+ start:721 stop:1044 length:324 start_codon:yes stop_codon:yes gene_type:complete